MSTSSGTALIGSIARSANPADVSVKPLIMVVEDQPGAREALADMLRHNGYRISLIKTAKEAVDELDAHSDIEVTAIL